MANKMLIDATHPEETRVVVTRGNRIEEFDFEAASKKQLRGNIYLARVTRVEPSLQAAFARSSAVGIALMPQPLSSTAHISSRATGQTRRRSKGKDRIMLRAPVRAAA